MILNYFVIVFLKLLLDSWLDEQNLKIALIKMFVSSKEFFVWHLSRRIIRMESAGQRAAIYRKKRNRDWLKKNKEEREKKKKRETIKIAL